MSPRSAMFSRKPAAGPSAGPSAVASRLASARAVALTAVQNPYVGAGGAGLLFLLTLVTLVIVTGDPQAGTPVVRISLAQAAASGAAVPGWREALAPEAAEAPVSTGLYALSESPIRGVESDPIAGSAFITVPGGGATHAAPGSPLAPAPLAGLTEPGPGGAPLPIVAADGRTPAEAYARPFTPNGKPKVALVVGGLGLNAALTRKAIETLPPEVTLSFAPYAEGLQGWIDLARANGHEVLLEAPMEPSDYPQNDPGPMTLLAASRPEETVRKLEWLLSRATGYFGLTNYLGSRFMATPTAMNAFSGALKARGVAFVDDGAAAGKGAGPMRASASRVIDDDLSAEAIGRQLTALEASARAGGQALGSGFAYPVTVDVAAAWARTLPDRGFQLAPVSALMRK
ncbi:MAG: divergent polysaccharide deacetylase family protein [Pseudomonadota bacterium]